MKVDTFLVHCGQILVLLLCTRKVASVTQAELDYMGTYLEIKIKTVDNLISELQHFRAELTLKNAGTEVIRGGDWALYFCFIRHIDRPDEGEPETWDYLQYGVNFTHVSGCLHRMEPTDSFRDISPNGETKITFLGVNWQVARTDYMPNWYVVSGTSGLDARTVSSTAGEKLDFVADFVKPRQWKRMDFVSEDGQRQTDTYDPYSLRVRHTFNDVNDLGEAPLLIIPTPVLVQKNDKKKVYFGTHDWVIVVDDQDTALNSSAQFLSKKLGFPIVSQSPDFRYIRFHVGSPNVMINGKQSNSTETYELRVNGDSQSVSITSNTSTGAFYGVQSLMNVMDENWESPEVTVKDAPRYTYRGMHLDVGRNFHGKEYVLKLLDLMAMYKLNKFYFHLTDDEGWRLEIPGLKELTTIGSKRCFDLEEKQCVVSQLGSGPTDQSSGTGYYTVAEYQEILRYAAERHIEVIPEFDMPGHGHAAIIAMQARHDALMSQGKASNAREYLLTDPNDTSVYESIQMFNDNAINPCMDSTYNFIRHVVREVVEMHENINPLRIFDFGGDEVAKGAWENSTECQHLMERLRNLQDAKDLKEYMVRNIADITAWFGVNMGAWEDGLMGRDNSPYDINKLANENVYAYAWDNVWEWGASNRPHKLANANFKVVMAQATHLYFDHPYEPDPEERGYYWAPRFTDTRKTFGFMPDNLYANVDYTRMGAVLTEEELCKEVKGVSQCVPLLNPENVEGMQGHLWSETVRTDEQTDYMIFPRLLALAERAWHKADWEDVKDVNKRKKMRNADWEKFANTLGYRELKRLDNLGVKYRVPQPGAHLVGNKLSTNVAFPGLVVEHSSDGGETWCSEKGISLSGRVQFRTRSADGGRTSRIESMEASKSTNIQRNSNLKLDTFTRAVDTDLNPNQPTRLQPTDGIFYRYLH